MGRWTGVLVDLPGPLSLFHSYRKKNRFLKVLKEFILVSSLALFRIFIKWLYQKNNIPKNSVYLGMLILSKLDYVH